MDKGVVSGFTVLELSKLHVYSLYYDHPLYSPTNSKNIGCLEDEMMVDSIPQQTKKTFSIKESKIFAGFCVIGRAHRYF